ncbi:MAG: cobalt-precorrin 5A hydrolase [Candidatus Methanoperedens sp.]|nr:cobalt-precorrin 5A hydrolase [Candidatus Methanoperedens sp.]CAG0988974.1 cobalt-precorrin 5A hydrolase [Methanosarcinales archaeon]
MGELAIIAFSRNFDIAKKIKDVTGGDIIEYSTDAFKIAFEKYRLIIAIMASGIAVRNIAPLLCDKWKDPAVVVIDSGLNFAIPILGGHHGGNELAKKLAVMGLIPVITTATEVMGKESVEGIADCLGCRIINRDSTKKVNLNLLDSDVEVLDIKGPKIVIVGDDVSILKRRGLIVGIGANRGVGKSEVVEAINKALLELDARIEDVNYFASAIIKKNESGIIDAAASFSKELIFVSHEVINSIHAPTPSKAKSLGLNGVCEPAALALSEEKKLLLKKRIYGNVTIAIAR